MENENFGLVSIIISTYKRNKEVVRAVKSAIGQTYNNIEVIVIDDNLENSIEQLQTYINLKAYIDSNKIRYIINNEVHGGSGCRNKGIKMAKGNFIAFLDDDDEYLPRKVEEQYKYFKEKNDENLAMIYCYARGLSKNKKIITTYKNDFEGNNLYVGIEGCIAGTSLWFVKKSAIIDIDGFFETPSKQDTLTIIKMMEYGYNIARVPKVLLHYYEYTGNKISGTGENAIQGRINLRTYSRKLYSRIGSEQKINNLEYKFSNELLSLYIINKKFNLAKIELKNIIKIKKYSFQTIKALLKYNGKIFYKIFLQVNLYLRYK